MAPLPSYINTVRMFCDYTSGGQPHTMLFRFVSGTLEADTAAIRTTLTTAIRGLMASGDQVSGWRWAAAGVNFTVPIAGAPTGAGTGGAGTINPENRTLFIQVVGRDNIGRRMRLRFFSILLAAETELRRPAGGLTGANQAWYNAVTDAASNFVSATGQEVAWNSYVNLGSSGYYQRKLR